MCVSVGTVSRQPCEQRAYQTAVSFQKEFFGGLGIGYPSRWPTPQQLEAQI